MKKQIPWKVSKDKVLVPQGGENPDPEKFYFDGCCSLEGKVYSIWIKKEEN